MGFPYQKTLFESIWMQHRNICIVPLRSQSTKTVPYVKYAKLPPFGNQIHLFRVSQPSDNPISPSVAFKELLISKIKKGSYVAISVLIFVQVLYMQLCGQFYSWLSRSRGCCSLAIYPIYVTHHSLNHYYLVRQSLQQICMYIEHTQTPVFTPSPCLECLHMLETIRFTQNRGLMFRSIVESNL